MTRAVRIGISVLAITMVAYLGAQSDVPDVMKQLLDALRALT